MAVPPLQSWCKVTESRRHCRQSPEGCQCRCQPKGRGFRRSDISAFHVHAHFHFKQHTHQKAVANIPDMSKYFGEDSTPGGIQFQFRTLKQYAKRQKACAGAGGNPQTLGIGRNDGEDSSTLLFSFPPLPMDQARLSKCFRMISNPLCLQIFFI